MSGFLIPPTFTPPQYHIARNKPIGYTLQITAGGAEFVAPGGSGGGVGSLLTAAPAGGSYTNYNPTGFGPNVGRLDITASAGDVTIVSLVAGVDAHLLIITNLGTNNLILQAGATGFRLPADLWLPQNDGALFCYYGGSVNQWCMA